MNEPYIIGIDIGTGSIKTLAMDFQGRVIIHHRFYYPSKGEATELDPEMILNTFKSGVKKIVDEITYTPSALAFSSMMHGIMAVDENCRHLTQLVLWSDTRSNEVAFSLRGSENGRKIYQSTGTPVHAMSPLCKIKWIQLNSPVVFESTYKFISIKEYIWFHLFAEYRIDHSIASATGLFNIHERKWDKNALAFAGIKEEKLSQAVPTNYSRDNLASSIAVEMGIDPHIPVYIGASDGCLANLGTLCLDSSVAAITIGTSAAARITRNKTLEDIETMPFNYILDDQYFICGGAINNGGNIIQWLVEKLISTNNGHDAYDELFKIISTIPAGSEGLLFLPYLQGERAPVWDENSSGVFFGIKMQHSQAHFARAALEGICFALAEILFLLERLAGPVHKIRLSGALARAPELTQALADITGKNILIQQDEDASSIGACYLALKSMGIIKDYEGLKHSESTIIKPKQGNVNTYRDYFELYKKIYPGLMHAMKELHFITNR